MTWIREEKTTILRVMSTPEARVPYLWVIECSLKLLDTSPYTSPLSLGGSSWKLVPTLLITHK